MSTEDKERIKSKASEFAKEYHIDVREFASKDFIQGAEYERTLANTQLGDLKTKLGLAEIHISQQRKLLASCEKALEDRDNQLAEKDKGLRELIEYKRLNTMGLSGYTTEELHEEIYSLKQALRELITLGDYDLLDDSQKKEIEQLLK